VDRLRLVLLSALMLFVELALIRWAGSNVVHLAYFSNFVLLGSFLGIGIGFLRAGATRDLSPWAPLVLAGLVAFIAFFPVEVTRSSGDDLILLGELQTGGPPRELVLAVIFVAVAAAMALIAEGVARTFVRFEPLEAYRLDIFGSIAGIVVFSVASFVGAPPLVWGLVSGVGLLALYRPRGVALTVVQAGAVAALVAMLAVESFAPDASWSAYYKVTVDTDEIPLVSVNGIPHQGFFDMTEDPPFFYALPYERSRTPLQDVLVIGAGGGNDVALALERGAEHVDAVEIDRRLHELGTELHPDDPYADPRVDVHIDDGRAFLQRTDDRYDLILFALPDSLTLVTGQSSLRLESYLLTQDAIQAAADRLRPGGVFAMYNFYQQPWLVDRLGATLTDVFGREPCVDLGGGAGSLAVLVDSERAGALRCETTWSPVSDPVPEAAADDHPFPYLRDRQIPTLYLGTIALILLASVVAVRVAAGPLRSMAGYVDLFFMGAAFLLLETKNVVQFSLLFGTTWFVNALVFTGILASVLAAVEVSRRIVFARPARLYGLLLAALAVAWLVPPSALLDLPVGLRFAAAVTLAFAPVFLANLVFAQRFRDVASSTTAFGANLLGAMVGGLIEYVSLLIGYRALLLVVAGLYGLAFLFGRSHLRARPLATVGGG
jgi:SAM-dependent methyltransferase